MENFSPWVIALDWMHMKYLGHDQLVYGSIFSLLTKFAMGGGSPLANLQILWGDIQSYYNSHQVPCRFRYLNKMSMFQRKEGQYPKLRGKAAEIKWLFGPMLYLWEKYHKPALQVHRQILLYLKLNYQVEEALVIHREALALPPEAASNFENSVTTMMLLLTSIAEHLVPGRSPVQHHLKGSLHTTYLDSGSVCEPTYDMVFCWRGYAEENEHARQNVRRWPTAWTTCGEDACPLQDRVALAVCWAWEGVGKRRLFAGATVSVENIVGFQDLAKQPCNV